MLNIKANCKCSYCTLRAATEVTGDDHAINREFDRIERTSQAKNKSDTQAKSPSAGTDGL